MERHHGHQAEIWLRPSLRMSPEVLLQLVTSGELTATPRLGLRDATHAKGYVPGERAVLRVLDERGQELYSRFVRIERVLPKPVGELQSADLAGSGVYHSWQEAQDDLSHFEKKPISADEMVSIISFSYLQP